MIGKGVVAALAGAILLAGGAAWADHLAPDKWVMHCKVDAMTDRRSCTLDYLATTHSNLPSTWTTVSFGHMAGSMLYLQLVLGKSECPGKPVILSVDKNEEVILPAESANLLVAGSAEALAEQFRAGERAVMRVYLLPQCAATDMTVSLKGFTTAWNRFEAEGK